MPKTKSVRTVLKEQREFRDKERRRHAEDIAAWILERGPVGPKLTHDVGLAPGRKL